MKICKIFVFSSFLLLSLQNYAQAKFSFETDQHNFGEIKEGTIATHEFVFKNIGDQPLIIANVRASCGCTTPHWTKEPVLPGETGTITASYNSKSRPGAFNKTITISSNSEHNSTILRIRGTVILPDGDIRKPTAAQLANSPTINIKNTQFALGQVGVNQTIPMKIQIKNTGKSKLAIVNVTASCRCIQIDPGTKRIYNPGEEGVTEILFSPRGQGQMEQTIIIQSTDLESPKVTLKMTASVVENIGDKNMVKEEKPIKF